MQLAPSRRAVGVAARPAPWDHGADTMPGTVSGQVLSRRVLVSIGIASVFVGAVVLAGALFRHHDPPRPTPRAPATTAASP